MKHLYLNLKRFDVPVEYGGVNRIAPIIKWGEYIVQATQDKLMRFGRKEIEFVQFYPEAHLIPAILAKNENSPIKIGCQGVYRMDTGVNGFGAFTTNRPASAVSALGATYTIIGHCEERNDIAGILAEGKAKDSNAVNRILNKEIQLSISRGLKVLYCIGEKSEEQENWQEVLGNQLKTGLDGIDLSQVVIGYEPIWSIGPGKIPADKSYIEKIARFIKENTSGIDVVYGGGLKVENAEMLASIKEIDGGLIALTRFKGDIGFYPNEYIEIIETYLGEY